MRLSESVVYTTTAMSSIVLCCVLFLSGSAAVPTPSLIDDQPMAADPDPIDAETPEPDDTATMAANPTTLGEALGVGDGTFDPTADGFHLFDPCTEITTEQWEKLGWKPLPEQQARSDADRKFCTFIPATDRPEWVTGFAESDVLDQQQLDQQGLLVADVKVTAPDGFYLYKLSKEENEFFCSAAVTTSRGRVSFTFGANPDIPTDKKRTCQVAADMLRDILELPPATTQ